MVKRGWVVGLLAALGLLAASGCYNLDYNCVGICGTTPVQVDGGYFAGVVSAGSLLDAINMCLADVRPLCDAGVVPNCACYLQQQQ